MLVETHQFLAGRHRAVLYRRMMHATLRWFRFQQRLNNFNVGWVSLRIHLTAAMVDARAYPPYLPHQRDFTFVPAFLNNCLPVQSNVVPSQTRTQNEIQ